MDSEPIMQLKSPCIMHLGRYRYRKLPTNFSDEADFVTSISDLLYRLDFEFLCVAFATHKNTSRLRQL